MSLGAHLYQILVLTVLASVTTGVTTSLTYYLLSRPWCIEFEVNREHTILYGEENCRGDASPHASPHAASSLSVEDLTNHLRLDQGSLD